jgi:hypothetical protein
MQTAKQVAMEVIDSLPDDCTLDDISYGLYLRRKLERSAADIEEGRTYTKQQVQEIVRSWFTSGCARVSRPRTAG